MKLLSASAVVAGANSVVLADCGLCGEHEHGTGTCPHFDYRGYGLLKGYKPEALPNNDFLGKLAVADRQNANAFLNIGQASTPTSSIVSFATPSGDTAGSTDTGVATSYDNTWSNTEAASQSSNEKPGASDKLNTLKFERAQDLEDSATVVSESDTNKTGAAVEEMRRDNANTEAASQSSNEKPGASDKINTLKFERTQDLEDSATMVSESDTNKTEAAVEEMRRDNANTEAASQSSNEKSSASDKINTLKFERTQDLEDSATMVSESDVSKMEREEAAIKIQNARRAQLARRDREETERSEAVQHLFGEDNMKTLARERDKKELKEMMKESIRKDGGNDPVYDVQTAGGLEILENSLPDRAQIRPRQDAEEVAYFNREKINISDEKKQEILNTNELERDEARAHKRAVNAEIARLNEKAASQRDTQELDRMVRERVAEDLGKSDAVKSKSEVRDLSLRHRGAEEAKDVAYDNRANINISDMKKLRIMGENLSEADKRRDRKELQSMMAGYRDHDRLSNELEAADLRLKRHNIESERALRKELAQQQKAQQNDGASELRNINEAANKIQRARRAQLARRKAKGLAEEQVKREAAAKKITDALRANKERRQAQRQAQIAGDYELAKKLQAEYDAEDRQIRADRLLAEQEQLRENLAAVPVEEARNGADFEYRFKQDQINADAILA